MPSKSIIDRIIGSISKIVSEESGTEKKGKSTFQQSHDEEIQEALFALAASVIRCDSNYTGETEKFIHVFMVKQFGPVGMKLKMESISQHLDLGSTPYIRIACKELNLLATHDSKLNIIRFLFGIAGSDNYVNEKEIRVIHRIATYLGISAADFGEIKLNFLSVHNPYAILGIEEGAPMEKVKNAYRKMALKYHPDKVKDASGHKDANEKFRQVRKAFETIRKSRNQT